MNKKPQQILDLEKAWGIEMKEYDEREKIIDTEIRLSF